MKKILVDTSIIIDFLRKKDKHTALFFQLASEDLYVSMISHTELYAGKSVWEKKDARQELETLFFGITILSLDKAISEKAGYLKAHSPDISLIDCIIGATALVNNMEVATLNKKDFCRFEKIKLYSPL